MFKGLLLKQIRKMFLEGGSLALNIFGETSKIVIRIKKNRCRKKQTSIGKNTCFKRSHMKAVDME